MLNVLWLCRSTWKSGRKVFSIFINDVTLLIAHHAEFGLGITVELSWQKYLTRIHISIRHTRASDNITRDVLSFFLTLQNDNHVNIRVSALKCLWFTKPKTTHYNLTQLATYTLQYRHRINWAVWCSLGSDDKCWTEKKDGCDFWQF
jgi:hypothetical protein